MLKEVQEMIRQCDICQRNKSEHVPYPGLLQPIPIPSQSWEVITMDFIEALPRSQGFDCILVVIDKFTKYAHFIPLSHPFTSIDVATAYLKEIYKLHGVPKVIISDRDKVFTSLVWQELMKLLGTNLHMSTAYHPQSDGQSERLNQCVEQYLRCMCFLHPKQWAKWVPLAEYWYNSSFHTALGMTPFRALYGYNPVDFAWDASNAAKVSSVEEMLKERENLSKVMVEQLCKAQERMKAYADKNKSERTFEIGDEVYLKLQPYKQTSLALRKNVKLSSKYFGPYPVIAKVGTVAYKLQLPDEAKIHPVFHVSLLKKKIGTQAVARIAPPDVSEEGQPLAYPATVLNTRMVKKGNQAVTQWLVDWTNLGPEQATWEEASTIQAQFPQFDPWGQGQAAGESDVMMVNEEEVKNDDELMIVMNAEDHDQNSGEIFGENGMQYGREYYG